jgi:hypothetical protein
MGFRVDTANPNGMFTVSESGNSNTTEWIMSPIYFFYPDHLGGGTPMSVVSSKALNQPAFHVSSGA